MSISESDNNVPTSIPPKKTSHVWRNATLLVLALVAFGTWWVYQYGGEHVSINGHTIDQLQPWEVVGGVLLAIIGTAIAIIGGLIALIIGLAATVIALLLAAGGVAVGLFFTLGTLLGPALLAVAIIMLIQRGNRKKDAVPEQTSIPEQAS